MNIILAPVADGVA